MMTKVEEKLKSISKPSPEASWKEKVRFRNQNKAWLKKSSAISLKILEALDVPEWSQARLARELNVSPQAVSKWVKGHENFTLETIAKLEEVLGIELISILKSDEAIVKKSVGVQEFSTLKSFSKEFLKDQVTAPSYKSYAIDFQVTRSSSLVAESEIEYKKSNNRKDKSITA